jgi:DNA topoisomerase-1
MEDKLDKIADGSVEYVKTLKDFYGPFSAEVKEKDKMDKATNLGDADSKFKCPICGSGMTIKLGRGGKFLSCAKYPECLGALTIDGEEIKGDTPIGHDPKTKLPIFVKTGKYGPYVQLGDAETLAKYATENPENVAEVSAQKIEVTTTGDIADATNSKKPARKVRKPKKPKAIKPKMASIPKGKDLSSVTIDDALRYLSLPRRLGEHLETGKVITANVGRFGPYIVHEGDFRSLKGEDNPYDITFERALAILKEPKKVSTRGRFAKKKKE